MRTPEHERLLRDVLHDENYLALRTALSHKLRSEFRRRRFVHRPYPLLALAASIALVGGWSLWWAMRPLVAHRAAPRFEIVRTTPLISGQVVTTAGNASILVVSSHSSPLLEVVHTDVNQTRTENISDTELFAFFKGHAVALASTAAGGKQLVFVDPQDQAEFFGKSGGN